MTDKDILEGRLRTVELEMTGLKTATDLFFKKEWPEFKAEHKAVALRVESLEKTIVRWGAILAMVLTLASLIAPIIGPEVRYRIFGPYQVEARK